MTRAFGFHALSVGGLRASRRIDVEPQWRGEVATWRQESAFIRCSLVRFVAEVMTRGAKLSNTRRMGDSQRVAFEQSAEPRRGPLDDRRRLGRLADDFVLTVGQGFAQSG